MFLTIHFNNNSSNAVSTSYWIRFEQTKWNKIRQVKNVQFRSPIYIKIPLKIRFPKYFHLIFWMFKKSFIQPIKFLQFRNLKWIRGNTIEIEFHPIRSIDVNLERRRKNDEMTRGSVQLRLFRYSQNESHPPRGSDIRACRRFLIWTWMVAAAAFDPQ